MLMVLFTKQLVHKLPGELCGAGAGVCAEVGGIQPLDVS